MKPLQTSSDIQLKNPKVVELEPKKAIYVRLQGDYRTIDYCSAYGKLWSFVKESKLFTAGIEHLTMGHDDPHVTDSDKLITDVCLVIHKEVSPKGEIGVRSVAGGKFLVFTYIGSYDNLFNVFDTIYRKWIPESNYQLRMEQGFEKYLNTPEKLTPDKLKTEIYIPVV